MVGSNQLLKRTIELIRESKESQLQICNNTGVSWYWMRKLLDGKIKDPSVNKIEKLYVYLTRKPLRLE